MSYDLQILRGTAPVAVAYASEPHVLQGSAKLATRFASLFLSDFDPVRNRGTDFLAAMRRGLRSDADVLIAFTQASFKVLTQLGDQDDLPASEHLIRADLTSHTLFTDHLTINVTLRTRDGVTAFVLPLKRVP